MADLTGGPMQQAVEAAAEALYEDFPGPTNALKWEKAGEKTKQAWRDAAKVGLLAAIPYLFALSESAAEVAEDLNQRGYKLNRASTHDILAAQRDALMREAP